MVSEERRCEAETRSGERCGNAVMRVEGDDGALCHVHRGLILASGEDGRRCEAMTRAGERCRHWGVADSARRFGRVLCFFHSRGQVAEDDERRCTAVTNHGKRCRNWATRASRRSGERLCGPHSRTHRFPNEAETAAGKRCEATTRHGERCPHWAAADSVERWGRPLCGVHGHEVGFDFPGPADDDRRCTAVTASGARCQHWALRAGEGHGEAQLCWMHRYPDEHGAVRHGFYRGWRAFSETERGLLRAVAAVEGPEAALLLATRLRLRRVLAYTAREEVPLEGWAPLVALVGRALRRVKLAADGRPEDGRPEDGRPEDGRPEDGPG